MGAATGGAADVTAAESTRETDRLMTSGSDESTSTDTAGSGSGGVVVPGVIVGIDTADGGWMTWSAVSASGNWRVREMAPSWDELTTAAEVQETLEYFYEHGDISITISHGSETTDGWMPEAERTRRKQELMEMLYGGSVVDERAARESAGVRKRKKLKEWGELASSSPVSEWAVQREQLERCGGRRKRHEL